MEKKEHEKIDSPLVAGGGSHRRRMQPKKEGGRGSPPCGRSTGGRGSPSIAAGAEGWRGGVGQSRDGLGDFLEELVKRSTLAGTLIFRPNGLGRMANR